MSTLAPHQISENFSAAKVMAILAVACAHYFPETPLWIAAEVALVIFAFSSGYFTATRYPQRPAFGRFWRAKLLRLGAPLLVINVFLGVLFLILQRPGVFSVYTPLSLLGLSGFYDWIGVHNQSAFGNGLWFFTVLILFYLAYPLLGGLFAQRGRAWASIAVVAVLCALGARFASPHYALWQVVFGFAFGIFAGKQNWQPTPRGAGLAWAALFLAALVLNALHLKQLNPWLFIGMSLASVAVLLAFALPRWATTWTAALAGCVLEIYFIHTYLFLPRALLGTAASFVLSMLLIVAAAWSLHRISSVLGTPRAAASAPSPRESRQ